MAPNSLPRLLGRRSLLSAPLRFSDEAGHPLRCMHRDDVDRKPFLDLHVDEAVYEHIHHVVRIIDVDYCPEIHPLGILAAINLESGCSLVFANKGAIGRALVG